MDLRAYDADWVFSGGELHLSVVCCCSCSPTRDCNTFIGNCLQLCILKCVLSTPDASLDQWHRRKTTAESFFYSEAVNTASVRV